MKTLLISSLTCLTVLIMTPLSMAAKSPYEAPNNSWISLSGTIVTAGTSSFELDYGEGIVTVEMDDWDWYGDAYGLLRGDEVTVYGFVDDDLYETTSIEASSVYLKDQYVFFHASGDDEEDYISPNTIVTYVDADLVLSGEVTQTTGREFTIDTGNRTMKVDTTQMAYNPMDNKGLQQINVGDRVQVSGDLDNNLFERKEIMADMIITLEEDKGKNEKKES